MQDSPNSDTKINPPQRDRDFDLAMSIAVTRYNLLLEARAIMARPDPDDRRELTRAGLEGLLMLAVSRAKPRSRLVAWHLADDIVEQIIERVAACLIDDEAVAVNEYRRSA